MLTKKRLIKFFTFLMIVSLLISACDRPLPSNDNDSPTPAGDGYPAAGETPAGEIPAGEVEPTREVLEEGETPAETEGEAGEPPAGEAPAGETPVGEPPAGEAPAEGGEEQESTSGEATATPEVMAEGETTEGEAETPAEGEAEAEGSEEPAEAEATPAAETPAETAPEAAAEGEQSAEPETVQPAADAQPLPATHTVVAGENLYRIGLQYGISWVAIANLNNISNPDRIFAGQVLQIPGGDTGGQPPPVPTPEGVNYIVKPGDTLFSIGLHFGISWVEIAEANGLVNPNQIFAGQTLKIPVDAPTPPPVIHHVVKPGETLFRISLQYGVPWLAIARSNNIAPPFIIYAGQTLVIPGGH
jgi:LysM repeat protein